MRYWFFFFLLFSHSLYAQTEAAFSESFLFGVANAPGHVEDELDDIWMDFGRKGGIKAFLNQDAPEERLKFWTRPEVEIELAYELGIDIFRLGVDWGRIHKAPGVFDEAAIARYREMIEMIRKKNMKVMLTLFHFTVPKWIQEDGGWTNVKTQDHFVEFSKKVMTSYAPLVDYWITFNEPQVFATMAYAFGVFPSGKFEGEVSPLTTFGLGPIQGRTAKALETMVASHKEIYSWAHKSFGAVKIGIAQHMGFHSGKNSLNELISRITGHYMNWLFPEKIRGYMDYFGFNFYGAEWIKGVSISIDSEEEYSEAGRAVYPKGLYFLSKEIQKRFPELPQFITENGIADSTDQIRPSYLIEHLMAINQLQKEKVQILGYIHWTLTDNMEWSDGYCPKFGLVSVDRKNNLARIKRPSFNLYRDIIKSRSISAELRSSSWNQLQKSVGTPRPFCRHQDGRTGLDVPENRPIKSTDWRFKSTTPQ